MDGNRPRVYAASYWQFRPSWEQSVHGYLPEHRVLRLESLGAPGVLSRPWPRGQMVVLRAAQHIAGFGTAEVGGNVGVGQRGILLTTCTDRTPC